MAGVQQPKQRVIVVYTGELQAAASSFSSVVLQDPARGRTAGFLISEDRKQLLELQQFKQMFSSWLIDGQLLAGLFIHSLHASIHSISSLPDIR
jgi:hypothetical protein